MKGKKRIAALLFALIIGSAGIAMAAQGGSVAQGDISVYKGGQLAEKLSGQNPIEDGSLLVCDGKCMIKSEGISLVAADQAKLAIKNEADAFNLILREGKVDFVITDKARKIAFHTPEGVYSVGETVFNAGNSPVVRGSVMVNSDGKTEISVLEGKMVFATAEGKQTVDANSKIVLAQSQVGGAGAVAGGELGALVGVGVVAGAGAIDNQSNKDGNPSGNN